MLSLDNPCSYLPDDLVREGILAAEEALGVEGEYAWSVQNGRWNGHFGGEVLFSCVHDKGGNCDGGTVAGVNLFVPERKLFYPFLGTVSIAGPGLSFSEGKNLPDLRLPFFETIFHEAAHLVQIEEGFLTCGMEYGREKALYEDDVWKRIEGFSGQMEALLDRGGGYGVKSYEEVRDALDGLCAYDSGAMDSGIKDEGLRERVSALLLNMSEAERRRLLAWCTRDLFLTEEAIVKGYGLEDAKRFAEWLDQEMGVLP